MTGRAARPKTVAQQAEGEITATQRVASIPLTSVRWDSAGDTDRRQSPRSVNDDLLELTILMPCLNEADTLATCIGKAKRGLAAHGIDGEVVIADNGSTDRSIALAEAAGARVVSITDRGYGAALMGGVRAARGVFVIMGDADDSYDFSSLDGFVDRLRQGDHW